MDHMISTVLEIPDYRIKQSVGIARGIVVRSRSIVGNFFAGIQTIFGGNISLYAELCEGARNDACNIMMRHAKAMGANAVVGVRYDTTDIMTGVTEVLCYGTAVVVERCKGE
tara:strand:+ start:1292 stop:1627 length:336 start_codon:yes stop_codon:yes gene_type:complete